MRSREGKRENESRRELEQEREILGGERGKGNENRM